MVIVEGLAMNRSDGYSRGVSDEQNRWVSDVIVDSYSRDRFKG